MDARLEGAEQIHVAGATGFIGRSLCAALVRHGYRTTALVRDVSGQPAIREVRRIAIGDIGPQTDWASALEGADVFFYLAGVAHRRGSLAPELIGEMYTVHAQAVERIVSAVTKSQRLQRIILVSSAGVMAAASSAPLSEKTPCLPASEYGASKLEGERILTEKLRGSSVEWCIIRPPLVYGPGNPGNMARLTKLVQLGVPLPFGSIRNRRSLIFVENLVDLLMLCIDHPAAARQVFLVSDGEDVSTPELARAIGNALHKPIRLFPLPRSVALLSTYLGRPLGKILKLPAFETEDVSKLWDSFAVDISKARTILGWKPPWQWKSALTVTLRINQ